MLTAGVATTASTGRLIDRFRDRAIFPIIHNQTVLGFVGRRHPHYTDQDQAGPKYLNTADTPLFPLAAPQVLDNSNPPSAVWRQTVPRPTRFKGLCPRLDAHRILGSTERREGAPIRAVLRAGGLDLCPRGSPQLRPGQRRRCQIEWRTRRRHVDRWHPDRGAQA